MDFEQLHTFITVAHQKNYSKSAAELNVTQPAVTTRIKNLEQEIGCTLFDRGNRSLSLTKEGESFLSYANLILKIFIGAQNAINLLKKTSLRLGFAPGIHPNFISRIINEVDLSDVNTYLECGKDTNESIRMLLEDKLNLALVSRPIFNKELIQEKILEDHLLFIVSHNHHLAKHTEITPDLLNGETIIFNDNYTFLWVEVNDIIASINLNYIHTNDQELTKELIKSGQGFACFPSHFFNDEDFKKLKVIPFKDLNAIQKDIYVTYKKEFMISNYFNPLINAIKNHLSCF